MCNNNNDCSCLKEILCTILKLQRQGQTIDDTIATCDRPFLGLNPTCEAFNTRPVTFYSCCNSTLWAMPYTLDDIESTSTVFRVEKVDDCCATLRVLAPNPDTTSEYPYVATESFFTINLNCVGAIKCLPDTYIACI